MSVDSSMAAQPSVYKLMEKMWNADFLKCLKAFQIH